MERTDEKAQRTPKEVLREAIESFAESLKGKMTASELEALAKAAEIYDGLMQC